MKSIIFIVLFLVASSLFSQDIIIKNNGDEIKSKVQEISISEIKYKNFDNIEGPIYTILKSEVFMIKYENGTKDLFKIKPSIKPLNNKLRFDGYYISANPIFSIKSAFKETEYGFCLIFLSEIDTVIDNVIYKKASIKMLSGNQSNVNIAINELHKSHIERVLNTNHSVSGAYYSIKNKIICLNFYDYPWYNMVLNSVLIKNNGNIVFYMKNSLSTYAKNHQGSNLKINGEKIFKFISF